MTSSRDEGGAQSTGRDLSAWSPEQRLDLAFLLDELRVPFTWEGSRLVFPPKATLIVDTQIELLSGRDASAGGLARPPSTETPDVHRSDSWSDGAFWDDAERVPRGLSGTKFQTRLPPRGFDDRVGGMRGGGIALVGFVGGFAAAIAVALALHEVFDDNVISFIALLVTSWTSMLVACFLASRKHGDGSLRRLGLKPLTASDLWMGFKSGLLLRLGGFGIAIVVLAVFGSDLGGDPSVSRGIDPSVLGIAVAVIGAPFFEELFFRGLVQAVLTRRWGARKAVFGQAALFALVHLWPTMSVGQIVLVFTTIFFVGVFLGGLRWRTESLGAGMASHATYNATAILLFLAVS